MHVSVALLRVAPPLLVLLRLPFAYRVHASSVWWMTTVPMTGKNARQPTPVTRFAIQQTGQDMLLPARPRQTGRHVL